MPDCEVYVLTCAGCGEKLTIRAGQPSEVRICPKCETLLDIEWRPDAHSGAETAQGAIQEINATCDVLGVPKETPSTSKLLVDIRNRSGLRCS